MKYRLLAILSILLIQKGLAQNIVPNPSFEDYTQCPNFNGQIFYCTWWKSPSTGTPDYFNSCSTNSNFSTPNNFVGSQYPHSGDAYVGVSLYYKPFSFNREYIQSPLINEMESNKIYCIEFYISLTGKISQYAINNIGVVFSDDTISNYLGMIGPVLDYTASINFSNIVTDTLNWVKISGSYLASGGEKYITIGNFFDNNSTDTLHVNNTGDIGAYYYIDDLSVIECDSIDSIANIFTPNGDGLNETFQIENLPPNSSLIVYSRWGNQVYTSDNYQNNWDGGDLSDGVYFYVLTLPSGNSTKGTVTILRGN